MSDRNILFMQPVFTRSGDAVRRPGATQLFCYSCPAWAGPDVQMVCPFQACNGFYRYDNS
jgi:hypothetical protein